MLQRHVLVVVKAALRGQHHVADIGMTGLMVKDKEGVERPYYSLRVGGGVGPNARIGDRLDGHLRLLGMALYRPDGKMVASGQGLAELADSVVQGCGQFCTNPGLVIGIASPAFTALASRLFSL